MSSYKRFYRTINDKKIAGVCGGIGRYLGIDPTLVRILFIIAVLCFSVGFWAYLIFWIISPEG